MLDNAPSFSIEQLEFFAEALSKTTDSFVYIFDLKADSVYISEQAAALFNIPGRKFDHAWETLFRLVYSEDYALFSAESDNIKS